MSQKKKKTWWILENVELWRSAEKLSLVAVAPMGGLRGLPLVVVAPVVGMAPPAPAPPAPALLPAAPQNGTANVDSLSQVPRRSYWITKNAIEKRSYCGQGLGILQSYQN